MCVCDHCLMKLGTNVSSSQTNIQEGGRGRGQDTTEVFPNILSRASSTSTSVTFRFPSRESFSVMTSEGTSSLTVSPSSSDLASQRSHGKMTVSEPCRERERRRGAGIQQSYSLIWVLWLERENQGTQCLCLSLGSVCDRAEHPHLLTKSVCVPPTEAQMYCHPSASCI